MKGSALKAAGIVAGVVAILAALALTTGRIALVTTTGSSMRPGISQGDLIVVAKRASYAPGDAVAYRSKELGRVVLHRIESVEGGRLVTRGDANTWTDTDRPSPAQIIGRRWLLVPQGGRVMAWLRSPWVLLAAAAMALALAGGSRRPKRTGTAAPSLRPAAGIVAAGCAALATIAFALPSPATETASIPYRHEGRFTYSAATQANPVYGASGLRTGDPIFLKIVPAIEVGFDYHFESERPAATLTASWEAIVDDGAGWKRAIPLDGATAAGTAFAPSTRLDVAGLWRQLEGIEQATGVPRGTYLVSLSPRVRVTGDGLDSTFSPSLTFRLDAAQMRLDAGAGPLNPTATGSMPVVRQTEARLPLVPVPAGTARVLLAAAAAIALAVFLTARKPPVDGARIPAFARRWIVPVTSIGDTTGAAETVTLQDVFRVADAAQQLVLWQQSGHEHTYAVRTDTGMFVHRVSMAAAIPIADPARRRRTG